MDDILVVVSSLLIALSISFGLSPVLVAALRALDKSLRRRKDRTIKLKDLRDVAVQRQAIPIVVTRNTFLCPQLALAAALTVTTVVAIPVAPQTVQVNLMSKQRMLQVIKRSYFHRT